MTKSTGKGRGGDRPNSGRTPDPNSKRQQTLDDESKARHPSGARMVIIGCAPLPAEMPPHEILAAIARGRAPLRGQNFDRETGLPVGEPFDVYPTWDQRIHAAEIAAPFHAAKMASIQGFQHFGAGGSSPGEVDASKLSDDEIDARLAAIAKERARIGQGGGASPPRATHAKARAQGSKRVDQRKSA